MDNLDENIIQHRPINQQNKMKIDYTQIRLKKSTAKRIRECGKGGESYDTTINRVLTLYVHALYE